MRKSRETGRRSGDKEEEEAGGLEAALGTAWTRLMWLAGLLMLQSVSSFILEAYRELVERELVITFFLTMLVGAGGNSGAQAAVSVIRGISTKKVRRDNVGRVLLQEFCVGALLAAGLFFVGFARVIMTRGGWTATAINEGLTVATALSLVVVVAVTVGATLPILFHFVIGIDSAHAGSSVQVVMDVLGVFFFVQIAMLMLNGKSGD